MAPPGFRFQPTDEELLVHYLKKKVSGKFMYDWIIGEIEIYKYEPADLPGLAISGSRDPEWFFFNAQDKKYLHGSRTNRTTKAGYWKATGKDRKVSVGSCVGMKKTLIYYWGRAPHGERTDWVMHEYRLDEKVERKLNSDKSFVLCRVRKKSGVGPRNGEQYGAPVLEGEEENDGNNSADEAYVLPFASAESMEERQVQDMPTVTTVIEAEAREDYDVFLENLLTFEEPRQDQIQNGDLLVDELLSILNNESDVALAEPMHGAPINFIDLSSMDNVSNLLHPADIEALMLEDMLHLASGQPEVSPEYSSGMQEPSHNYSSVHMDDSKSVGFLELADLENPDHEQSALESSDLERLIFELDNDMEFPVSFLQGELQMQQIVQSSGDRESIRGLQNLGGSVMNNELEVPLDSSQGLSVLESIHNRILTSDDEVLPSGLTLSSDQEGAFAHTSTNSTLSQSHLDMAYEQHEAQHAEVDNYVENGSPLLDSAARLEIGQLVDSTTHAVARCTDLRNDNSNTAVYLASSPSSPSSFVRVISGILGKVGALPASAAELPVTCESLENEQSVCFATHNNVGDYALTHPGPSSISGSLLSFRVKLKPLQDGKLIARTPELELQWSVSSIATSDQGSMRSCKSFTNGLSMFFFWITTLSLILFCMFRGLCRSSRVALI